MRGRYMGWGGSKMEDGSDIIGTINDVDLILGSVIHLQNRSLLAHIFWSRDKCVQKSSEFKTRKITGWPTILEMLECT